MLTIMEHKLGTVVKVINSVEYEIENKFRICFQNCRYIYDDGGVEAGFRFMWRTPEGKHLAHRGQARIPSKKIHDNLVKKAEKEGWF